MNPVADFIIALARVCIQLPLALAGLVFGFLREGFRCGVDLYDHWSIKQSGKEN